MADDWKCPCPVCSRERRTAALITAALAWHEAEQAVSDPARDSDSMEMLLREVDAARFKTLAAARALAEANRP